MITKCSRKINSQIGVFAKKPNKSCFVACNQFDTTVKINEYQQHRLCRLLQEAAQLALPSRRKRAFSYLSKYAGNRKKCRFSARKVRNCK